MKQLGMIGLLLFLGACQTLPTSAEWLARGDGYFKDGKLQQALKAYNRAQRLNPDNPAVYSSRGAAYFFMGDFPAAQADFVQVLQLNPYRADGYNAFASALAAQGHFTEALEAVNLGIRLAPGKMQAYFTRGGIYFMLGQYKEAVADYTRVLRAQPSADVYRARGAAYAKMEKKAQAEEDFKVAASGAVPEKLSDYTMID